MEGTSKSGRTRSRLFNSIDLSPSWQRHHRYALCVSRENRRALQSTACGARLGTTWTGLLHNFCSGLSDRESASCTGYRGIAGLARTSFERANRIPERNTTGGRVHKASSRFGKDRQGHQPTACDEAIQELVRTSAISQCLEQHHRQGLEDNGFHIYSFRPLRLYKGKWQHVHHADAIRQQSAHHWTIQCKRGRCSKHAYGKVRHDRCRGCNATCGNRGQAQQGSLQHRAINRIHSRQSSVST